MGVRQSAAEGKWPATAQVTVPVDSCSLARLVPAIDAALTQLLPPELTRLIAEFIVPRMRWSPAPDPPTTASSAAAASLSVSDSLRTPPPSAVVEYIVSADCRTATIQSPGATQWIVVSGGPPLGLSSRRFAVRFDVTEGYGQTFGVQADGPGPWPLMLSTNGRPVYGFDFDAAANAAVRAKDEEDRKWGKRLHKWDACAGAVFEFEWVPVTEPAAVRAAWGRDPKRTPAPRMRVWPRLARDRVIDAVLDTRDIPVSD
jgi:hypothetical protein